MKKLMLIILGLMLIGSFSIVDAHDEGKTNTNWYLKGHELHDADVDSVNYEKEAGLIEREMIRAIETAREDTDANFYLSERDTIFDVGYGEEILVERDFDTMVCDLDGSENTNFYLSERDTIFDVGYGSIEKADIRLSELC